MPVPELLCTWVFTELPLFTELSLFTEARSPLRTVHKGAQEGAAPTGPKFRRVCCWARLRLGVDVCDMEWQVDSLVPSLRCLCGQSDGE